MKKIDEITSYQQIGAMMEKLRPYSKNGLFEFCEANNIPYPTNTTGYVLLDIIEDTLLSRLNLR